ncbi:TolC family protein [Pedobacter sp. MR2016-19]|uniref:TolC family protein n=1 Tax=Pedobacter sp. MR2016-19 TaxID=2780089 RepID=UPI00187497FA|nr:TolC family protein [Pedobacter sp. MR2016-19]MBE5320870.1 TolC family protein [Pedobacter sp. MR2016-19]
MNIKLKCLILCLITFWVTGAVAQTVSKNLDYYLKQAEFTSPVLKDLQNQQRSAGIDSLIVRATGGPQVTASSAGMYAPIVRSYGYDEVLTNGQALEALLNVNYDLLNKKRINNQLEAIKIQNDSIKYAGQLSLYDLQRSIADQYILAYASQEQVGFNREVVTLLEQEEALFKKLTRSNIYKQSEYLTFLVTLQQQQLVVKQAELQFKNDYATLNYLAGITDTTQVKLADPQLQVASTSIDHSFFNKRFDIDSLKNINQKNAINFNYKPKLGVYANGGYNSSFVLQPYKNFGASIGFTFSVPIYDGHQKKMEYNKLRLSSKTISGYRDFFVRQQQQQLNLIRQQINQTDALFPKINEQIRFSKGLIEVDSKLMHTGDLKVADFVIAINNYMSAQNLLRQTNINRLKLINQFNYWNR